MPRDSRSKKSDGVCRTLSGQPLSQHYVFDNIHEHRRLLALGSGALKGIGAMMEVGLVVANEEVSAKRDELADIFTFFGEVMAGHVESIAYSGETGQSFHAKLDSHSIANWTVGA